MRFSDPIQAFRASTFRPQLISPSDLPEIWAAAFPRAARRPPLVRPQAESWDIPAAQSQAIEQSTQFRRFEKARAVFLAMERAPRPDLLGAEPAEKEAARRALETAREKAVQAHAAWQAIIRVIEVRNRPAGELNDALLRWMSDRRGTGQASREEEVTALRRLQDACGSLLRELRSPIIQRLFEDRFGHQYLFSRIEGQLGANPPHGTIRMLEEARQVVLYDERFLDHLAKVGGSAGYWRQVVAEEPGKPGPREGVARHTFVLAVVRVFEALANRRATFTRIVGNELEGKKSGVAARFLAAICKKASERLASSAPVEDPSLLTDLAQVSIPTVAGGWIREALRHRTRDSTGAPKKARKNNALQPMRRSAPRYLPRDKGE